MTRHVGFHECATMTPAGLPLRFASNASTLDPAGIECLWLDRGESRLRLGREGGTQPRLVAATRSASLGLAGNLVSFWLVLRGTARVECRQGRFQLGAGTWLALEHDAHPTIATDAQALVVAMLLPATGSMAQERDGWPPLLPGRGRIGLRDRRLAFAHCRRAGLFASVPAEGDMEALRHMAHFLASLQSELTPLLARCPGRALWRRRLVLARLQAVSLFLDGNLHRSVRLAELAEMSHFSTWYFHKTFHAVYGAGPREMAARLRLRLAAELLANTSLSIGEVSSQCGFQNPCSFARAFRSHFDQTASAYRRSRPGFGYSRQRDAGRIARC